MQNTYWMYAKTMDAAVADVLRDAAYVYADPANAPVCRSVRALDNGTLVIVFRRTATLRIHVVAVTRWNVASRMLERA